MLNKQLKDLHTADMFDHIGSTVTLEHNGVESDYQVTFGHPRLIVVGPFFSNKTAVFGPLADSMKEATVVNIKQ